MPLTKTGKLAVKGTSLILIAVGIVGFGYIEYQNTQNIAEIANKPVPVITKTIIVTPTLEPTASPSATLKPKVATPKVTLKVTK